MKKVILSCVAAFFLSGCVVSRYAEKINDAEILASQKQWEKAFSEVELTFRFNSEPVMLRNLITKYPEVITIGMKKVYEKKLQAVKEECNQKNFDSYRYAIQDFGRTKYAGATKNEILSESRTTLNECAANPKSSAWLINLTALEGVVGTEYFYTSTKKQAAITEEKEKREERENNTGIIISAQVANESYVNNGAGASIGSALAQAQYIDNANFRNYSVTNQLGAGLIGAIIGAVLGDRPSAPSYRSTYFIKSLSGNIKQVEDVSSSPAHLPEGACVEAVGHNVTIINQNNCAGISLVQK